jgi:predicted enzyme related to lactoylglutathione lyase
MSNAEVLGRFVWHELLTNDTAGAAAFYPKVLPWRTAPSSMPGYTIWMAGQTQIGGLMALPSEAGSTPPHWLVYVGTPNVDSTCSQAQGLGARVVKPPADIPNVGRFAVLSDPQGATFAVFTPGGGPPPGGSPAQGTFSWHELATTDVAAALRFYGQLFGWTKGPGHDMGGMGIYQLFQHGGTQVGGICNVQGPSTAPSWLSYVHVADSGRAVAAGKAAGGRLLHGPMEVPGGSWIAMMMDPQGGAFAVQEPPRAAQSKPAGAAKPAAAAKPPASAKPAAAAAKPAAAAAKPAAASSAAPAAAPLKRVAGTRVAKRAKKGARKVRRTARKTARKVRRTGRKTARRMARPGARRAVRKAARKTARATRRGGRRVARRVRVAGRRLRRAARRRR